VELLVQLWKIQKNKKLIAYQEVGHAIIGSLLQNHDKVGKVTLIPRGSSKGLTWFAPDEDQMLISRAQLLARITSALGGRVAEKVIFGETEVTTGVSGDIQQVTRIARQMVTRYGMSTLGPIALENDNNELIFKGEMSNRIDAEVCRIVNHCEQLATRIIRDNRVIVDLIVERLLDAETLDGDEFRKLVEQYTIPPVKQ
jgi:cell division protease FtsH